MKWQVSRAFLLPAVILLLPVCAAAQGTPADYARAAGLRAKYEGAAVDIAGAPAAIGRTHRFWYRKSGRGAEQFVEIDAETLQKRAAFDHEKIARSLSSAAGRSYQAGQLPFNTLTFDDDGSAFIASVEGSPYRCTISDSLCRKVEDGLRGSAGGPGRRRSDDRARLSPDGRWEAFINNYNVAIRPSGTRAVTPLSTDGSEGNHYELRSIAWSPDSQKIAAYRVRPGYRREVHYVESSPEDQLQPKHSTLFYAKPGDVLDVSQPVLFLIEPDRDSAPDPAVARGDSAATLRSVAAKRQIIVDNALFPNPYATSELVWRKDSRAFTFEYNQRGHQVYRVIEVDAATGAARAVISEEPKTFFNYRTATTSSDGSRPQ
jgi:hypothetical protein